MTWATRCPSCTTVFRVAEDQLRVSEGFVRCGRCDSVFNAREHLFDLDSVSAPTPLAETAPPPPPAPPPATEPEPQWAQSTQLEAPEWVVSTQQLEEPLDRTEPVWEETQGDTQPGASEDPNARMRELLDEPRPAGPMGDVVYGYAPAPAFASLNSAPKAKHPRLVRALSWVSVALLALALPLQWAWIEREALRAQWPALESAWLNLCGKDCAPVAWARIEGLAVAASSLQPTPQGEAYQLKLRIENRARHSLAMPWLDLSLSDPDGKLLLRRSLSPKELGSSLVRLESGASVELQATFNITGKLAGYEIGLFQP